MELQMMMMIFLKYYYLQGIIGLLALLSLLYYTWVSIIKRNKTKTTNTSNKEASYKGVVAAPPPDVAGAWTVVGHLPQLVRPKQPLFRVLGDMADKYGPIFMVRFGMYPTLVVSSWEIAKECFTTNDRVLASRPASAASKYLTYDYAMFGFTFYGPYWREIRKISTIELLSIRRLELLKHVPFTEIDTCIRRLYRLWMKNHRNGQKQLGGRDDINDPSPSSVINNNKVDMSQLFGDLTLNVVLKLVAGKRLLNINDNTEEDKDSAADQHDHQQQEEEAAGRKLHETIVGFFKLIGVSAASDALPFLGWLDLDGQKRNMKKISKEMDLIAQKWLEEHRQKRSLSRRSKEDGGDNIGHDGGGRHENDFIDVLLSVFEDGASDHDHLFMNYSRDTVIKATALSIIVAASDTTSLTLTWALSLLLNNHRVLRKAQDELDIKVGKDRHVEERDIENLVYLQAIVKETLRMYPAGPLSVPHEATEDCNVGGYHIRAGTRVLVNLWKLHRDPRVWSNPSEFKPERFLLNNNEGGGGGGGGEAANLDFRGQHFEYIPFGSGRRMCPGINFGLQTIHMTLARLLHAFELQLPSSSSSSSSKEEDDDDDDDPDHKVVVDMTEGSGLTMPKVTPLEVLLHPRLPLPLYE